MASASRVLVPSSSMAAVKAARPGRPAGSAALPERTTSWPATMGSACDSIQYTVRPFGSWNECAAGRVAFGVGPGLGTSPRHGSFEGGGVGAGAAAAAGAPGGVGGNGLSPG